MNLDLQRAGRVLPFPFHFIDSNHAMNVRPLNYGWREFYDLAVDLTRYALKGTMVRRRFLANRTEEHTYEIQSIMRITYAVLCLKKQNNIQQHYTNTHKRHTWYDDMILY